MNAFSTYKIEFQFDAWIGSERSRVFWCGALIDAPASCRCTSGAQRISVRLTWEVSQRSACDRIICRQWIINELRSRSLSVETQFGNCYMETDTWLDLAPVLGNNLGYYQIKLNFCCKWKVGWNQVFNYLWKLTKIYQVLKHTSLFPSTYVYHIFIWRYFKQFHLLYNHF